MRIPSYVQRRWLRALERAWTYVEHGFNRLVTSRYNPLYHLGTLALFLLVVLAVTGTYMVVFYRPGMERAHATVAQLDQQALGRWVRTVHRYAADALLVVVLLHALKMWLSERFAAARWVAWVTGWLLTVWIWLIGVMGYWLAWDTTAQAITEFLVRLFGPSLALTFYGPGAVSKSFAFFVIVLFLHVFLAVLLVLLFLLHVLRLSRPRWMPPRWLMVYSAGVLGLLALVFPVTLGPKADFTRVVTQVDVDWLYLAFLPLSERWGPAFWAGVLVLMAVLLVMPWVLPDRHAGPARIVEHLCTGCGLGALKCPYQAIELLPRGEEHAFRFVASIKPELCLGCGLCLGTCAVISIDLEAYPTQALLHDLRTTVTRAREEADRVALVVTCQRHAALGSLPVPMATVPGLATYRASPDTTVVLWALPCVGMLNPEWVREQLTQGGVDAVGVLSCPTMDCAFREGPFWLAQNLKFRRNLLARPLYWEQGTPGHPAGYQRLWVAMQGRRETAEAAPRAQEQIPRVLEEYAGKLRGPRGWRSLAVAAALLVVLALALWVQVPWSRGQGNQAALRLLMAHGGQIKAPATAELEDLQTRLPPGVSAGQVLGGERYPVALRVEVDGQVLWEGEYEPSGLRNEGLSYAFEELTLAPGNHRVRVTMMDDGQTWRTVFEGEIPFDAGRVWTLVWDDEAGRFVPMEP